MVDDPLHLGLTSRETPEERRLRKRVFLKDDIKWWGVDKTSKGFVSGFHKDS